MTTMPTIQPPTQNQISHAENEGGVEFVHGKIAEKRAMSTMATMQMLKSPTPEEILRAEEEGGVEFVHGQIVEKPVSNVSSNVASNIAYFLQAEARKTASASVFDCSMGYKCFVDEPSKFRKPDVSVVATSRLKLLPAEFGLFRIAPDLAIEVISPTDLACDVEEKLEEYLAGGFPLLWIVHPNTSTVTVYRADGTVTRLHQSDDISGESAMPTFKCKVAEFFKTPRPPE